MSIAKIKKIYDLELSVLNRGEEMRAEEAREFHDMLISYHKEFLEFESRFVETLSGCSTSTLMHFLSISDCVEKRVNRLQNTLRRFLASNESTSSSSTGSEVIKDNSNEIEPSNVSANLDSRIQKQKVLIKLIESLEPKGEISANEAEIRRNHLASLYESFTSNQMEIATCVKDAPFDDQVKISEKIQHKVILLQTTLKEIITSIETPSSVQVSIPSKQKDECDRIERPHIIADFLDSLFQKQKSLIEQIESFESSEDRSEAEAEVFFDHLSQLHKSFMNNQTKIETYVNGNTLNSQLQISRAILQKVMSLKVKLKEKIATGVSSFSKDLKVDDQSDQTQLPDRSKLNYLKFLIEKQESLIQEIEKLDPTGVSLLCHTGIKAHVLSFRLQQFYELFASNQMKIEALARDEDVQKQADNFKEIQEKVLEFQQEWNWYQS